MWQHTWNYTQGFLKAIFASTKAINTLIFEDDWLSGEVNGPRMLVRGRPYHFEPPGFRPKPPGATCFESVPGRRHISSTSREVQLVKQKT